MDDQFQIVDERKATVDLGEINLIILVGRDCSFTIKLPKCGLDALK